MQSRTIYIIPSQFNKVEPRQKYVVEHQTATACVKMGASSSLSVAPKHIPQAQFSPKSAGARANSNHSSLLRDSSLNTQTFLFTWRRFMASALDHAHRRKNEYQR